MAVGAPVQGRLIDRRGPKAVLAVTGVASPLALLGILLCARHGLGFGPVATCAALAGFFATPITVLTRTLWRMRFTRDDDRRRAFSIDAVMIELNFTLGPAIVAGVVAVASPTAAFGLAIAVVVASFLVFVASPALKYFKPEPPAERHMLGPLTDPHLLLVFAATFGLTMAFGQLEVGYPAYATFLALPALGGILLATNSFGSALGGALFGGLTLKAPVERQFAATLAIMAVPLALHAFVDGPFAFAAAAFLAGAAIAPSIACQSVLVSRLAPAKYATEAFTWSSTFIVSGLGAGMAVGGWLSETQGPKTPFVAGAVLVASMALVARQLPVRPAAHAGPAAH
jgi:MFS family permease